MAAYEPDEPPPPDRRIARTEPLIAVLPLYEGGEVAVFASDGRALLFPPET